MNTKQKYRWIPKDSQAIEHPQKLGIAYYYTTAGSRAAVVAYSGNRSKADYHHTYKTEEQARENIKTWFEALTQSADFKAQRRIEQRTANTFQIGDIISNSWGYDQTNVDFYLVVRRTDSYVWLQPISSYLTENGTGHSMAGYVKAVLPPQPITYRIMDEDSRQPVYDAEGNAVYRQAPVERHAANAHGVTFKYGSGSKWNGEAKYESWYA
jgi:hypothetical protein